MTITNKTFDPDKMPTLHKVKEFPGGERVLTFGEIREFYAKHGYYPGEDSKIIELRKEIADLKEEIADLKNEIELRKEIADLKNEILKMSKEFENKP